MTEIFYRTGTYKPYHSTFGGSIYKGDYDEPHSLADIASRIASDMKIDERCRRNIEMRKRAENYNKQKGSGNKSA